MNDVANLGAGCGCDASSALESAGGGPQSRMDASAGCGCVTVARGTPTSEARRAEPLGPVVSAWARDPHEDEMPELRGASPCSSEGEPFQVLGFCPPRGRYDPHEREPLRTPAALRRLLWEVDPREVDRRLSALPPGELAELWRSLAELPPGGGVDAEKEDDRGIVMVSVEVGFPAWWHGLRFH